MGQYHCQRVQGAVAPAGSMYVAGCAWLARTTAPAGISVHRKDCHAARLQDAAAAAAADGGGGGHKPVASIPGRLGVVGAGPMGEALIRGFLKAKISSPGKICCSVNTFERRQALESLGIGKIFGDATDGGAQEVAACSNIIILGVKVGGTLERRLACSTAALPGRGWGQGCGLWTVWAV